MSHGDATSLGYHHASMVWPSPWFIRPGQPIPQTPHVPQNMMPHVNRDLSKLEFLSRGESMMRKIFTTAEKWLGKPRLYLGEEQVQWETRAVIIISKYLMGY